MAKDTRVDRLTYRAREALARWEAAWDAAESVKGTADYPDAVKAARLETTLRDSAYHELARTIVEG